MFDLPADLVDYAERRFNEVPLRREIIARGFDNESLIRLTGLGLSTIEKVRQCKHALSDKTIGLVMEALRTRRSMQEAS